jgi:UDP-glucose 4-epimerase
MRILVTGGMGYIGSVVGEELIRGGHEVIAYDNLSKGHLAAVAEGITAVKGELADRHTLTSALRKYRIEAVFHMAADSLVGESVTNPLKYYRNNVVTGLVLLDSMLETGIKRIVFSSTAAVYGEPLKQPIEETDPTSPTNPYGESKLAFERALHWLEKAHGLRYASLRYFNAAGATERCGESHDPETHLIPIVLETAMGKQPHVEVYGNDYPTVDGTCVRDYIHVTDIARAHVLALQILDERSGIFNLGSGGRGFTVQEIIEAARHVTGLDIPTRIVSRRPGDPAVLIASSEKSERELSWIPLHHDIKSIIGSAWRWMEAHPRGYEETSLPRIGTASMP